MKWHLLHLHIYIFTYLHITFTYDIYTQLEFSFFFLQCFANVCKCVKCFLIAREFRNNILPVTVLSKVVGTHPCPLKFVENHPSHTLHTLARQGEPLGGKSPTDRVEITIRSFYCLGDTSVSVPWKGFAFWPTTRPKAEPVTDGSSQANAIRVWMQILYERIKSEK